MANSPLAVAGSTLAFAACLASFGQRPSTPEAPVSEQRIAQARERLITLAASYPGFSIAVGVGDRLVWTEAWGLADIENNVAATPDTRYPLYSVSKPITGLLAARLVTLGVLDARAPISRYLPDLPASYSSVTTEHLLGHLAGVRHYRETGDDPYAQDQEWMRISAKHCESVSEALPRFIDDELEFPPGEKRGYSSYGYTLLSAVLEAAAGQPFAELINEHVFEPAGAFAIAIDDPAGPSQRARLYVSHANGEFRLAPQIDNSCRFGGGGLTGSVVDVAKIGLAYANGTLFPERGEALVQAPIYPAVGESSNGYGFAVASGQRNGVAFTAASHGGGALGGRSYVFVIPTHDVSVAMAGNLEGPQLFEVAFEIGFAFAGIPSP